MWWERDGDHKVICVICCEGVSLKKKIGLQRNQMAPYQQDNFKLQSLETFQSNLVLEQIGGNMHRFHWPKLLLWSLNSPLHVHWSMLPTSWGFSPLMNHLVLRQPRRSLQHHSSSTIPPSIAGVLLPSSSGTFCDITPLWLTCSHEYLYGDLQLKR